MNDIRQNAGRCVVCGKPIDMESGDKLVCMEQPDIDHPEISREEANKAMADALRRDDAPESHTLAKAYEEGEEIILHDECHDKTNLPNMYSEL